MGATKGLSDRPLETFGLSFLYYTFNKEQYDSRKMQGCGAKVYKGRRHAGGESAEDGAMMIAKPFARLRRGESLSRHTGMFMTD